jgi:hypothetical protein
MQKLIPNVYVFLQFRQIHHCFDILRCNYLSKYPHFSECSITRTLLMHAGRNYDTMKSDINNDLSKLNE